MKTLHYDKYKWGVVFLIIMFLMTTWVAGQQRFVIKDHYDKIETMAAMRDGVNLFTQVYTPQDKSQKYPIMLFRTPYSIGNYGEDNFKVYLGPSRYFAPEGYIFVYQDVRGKYKSEGEFTVMDPIIVDKRGPEDVDESSDTYDAIEWILKNVSNHNGRVGQWGISYPGWQTVQGMIDAHPAMKASSPQASPADMWIGDDFHHNGAFRLMYTFHWLSRNAATRVGPSETRATSFDYGTNDGYEFFLDLGPVKNVDERYFHKKVPTWNEYMEHGDYDEYWKEQDVLQHLNDIDHAILNVAAWFDAEDFYGPMSIYYEIEKRNPGNKSMLVVGPWRHGGWAREGGESTLGDIHFGSNTQKYYQEQVELPFFNYYLKDKGEMTLAEAVVFETGSNQWKQYNHWPPQEAVEKNLYLQAGGKLSFDRPRGRRGRGSDEFVSDMDNPAPFSAEKRNTQGHTWMVEDQRFAAGRDDVLVYQTDVLVEDVVVAGPIIADLFVTTTGTDADWVVKLIDVFPGDEPDNKTDVADVSI
ncbi:MAG: CocE/NonD family hydrolase, partial [Planctomycetes bacterium]|nr:CocE/NonD family hydrolase [Planctomycetota bacterium]